MSDDAPRPVRPPRRRFDPASRPPTGAERAALWIQFGFALALVASFLAAGWTLLKFLPGLPIEPWQKVMFEVGLGAALVVFGRRAVSLWRRLHQPPDPPA